MIGRLNNINLNPLVLEESLIGLQETPRHREQSKPMTVVGHGCRARYFDALLGRRRVRLDNDKGFLCLLIWRDSRLRLEVETSQAHVFKRKREPMAVTRRRIDFDAH